MTAAEKRTDKYGIKKKEVKPSRRNRICILVDFVLNYFFFLRELLC